MNDVVPSEDNKPRPTIKDELDKILNEVMIGKPHTTKLDRIEYAKAAIMHLFDEYATSLADEARIEELKRLPAFKNGMQFHRYKSGRISQIKREALSHTTRECE